MSQSSTLSVYMVKERLPKYCYLHLSDDDDEETLDLLDQINFKIMCAMPLTMSLAARLTRVGHIVIHVVVTIWMTMIVNSDGDGRDDHVLDNNDDPIEKNEANSDFQRKYDAFKPNGCT